MTERRPYDSRQWRELRLLILQRDKYECQIRLPTCLGVADRVDHIVGWRQGGKWYDPMNLRSCCHPCNVAARYRLSEDKHRVTPPAWADGERPIPPPSREW